MRSCVNSIEISERDISNCYSFSVYGFNCTYILGPLPTADLFKYLIFFLNRYVRGGVHIYMYNDKRKHFYCIHLVIFTHNKPRTKHNHRSHKTVPPQHKHAQTYITVPTTPKKPTQPHLSVFMSTGTHVQNNVHPYHLYLDIYTFTLYF